MVYPVFNNTGLVVAKLVYSCTLAIDDHSYEQILTQCVNTCSSTCKIVKVLLLNHVNGKTAEIIDYISECVNLFTYIIM